MEVELLQEFFLDPRADTVPEEDAVRDDHAATTSLGAAHRPAKFSHDELNEEQSGFCGLFVFRKVRKDAPFFLASEGRVRHDDVHAVSVADLAQGKTQGIARINLRIFQAVE